MKKIKHNQQSSEEITPLATLNRCFLYCIIFFVLSFSILLILSLVFINTEGSTSYAGIIGKVTLYLSLFICAFILSKRNGKDSIFSGVLLGAMVLGVIFIISLIYPQSTENNVIWLILIPTTAIVGSFLGKGRRSKRPKHKTRRK